MRKNCESHGRDERFSKQNFVQIPERKRVFKPAMLRQKENFKLDHKNDST